MANDGASYKYSVAVDGEKELINLKRNQEEMIEAAKRQKQAEKELAAEQKKTNTLYKKLALGQKRWSMALKSGAEDLGLLVSGLSRSLGVIGPWAAAIGGALGLLMQLYKRLAKPPETKPTEDRIKALTEAYKSLGDAASYAAAKQKLQAEDVAQRSVEELIKRNQDLERIKTQIAESESRTLELQRKYITASDAGRRDLNTRLGLEEQKRLKLEEQKEQLEGYIETQQKALAEEKRAREQREDAEIEHQHLVAYERERMQKREKEIEEQRRKREKAAADAARQREKELSALAKLRDEAEKMAFKESSAGRIETLEREYEKRKKLADEEFLDQKRRAQALTQIETMRVIAVEGEKQRIREELAKKSASVTATSSAPQTQAEKAEADWRTLREKILTEVQQLEEIQAQYEREFTASELSSSAEYLAIKDRQIEASKRLAEEQLNSLSRVSAARAEDAHLAQKETFDQVYAQHALTEAQKAAADAAQKGFEAMANGLEAWGVESTAIQKMQMVASGIQAGADAIDYGARALAYFASGNPIAGAGMMAASAGKTAAAAAYAAGVADLGGSAPRTASAPSGGGSYSSSSLTGSAPKESNEITVNFAFEGSDNQIASALIRGLNATTGTLGRQKLKKNVISERV